MRVIRFEATNLSRRAYQRITFSAIAEIILIIIITRIWPRGATLQALPPSPDSRGAKHSSSVFAACRRHVTSSTPSTFWCPLPTPPNFIFLRVSVVNSVIGYLNIRRTYYFNECCPKCLTRYSFLGFKKPSKHFQTKKIKKPAQKAQVCFDSNRQRAD